VSEREEQSMRERVVGILHGGTRVEEHVGERSEEGVQADIANLGAAARELQQIVVLLGEELDRQR
jgi:hypothetical protein